MPAPDDRPTERIPRVDPEPRPGSASRPAIGSAGRSSSAAAGPPSPGSGWWGWCGRRPWLAALCTVAGGLTIALVPNADFSVVVLPGVAGLSGMVLGLLLVASGLWMAGSPPIHGLLGVAAVLLSLVSFISSNLGGLLVGMLLGLVGGSLAVAWQPPDPDPR